MYQIKREEEIISTYLYFNLTFLFTCHQEIMLPNNTFNNELGEEGFSLKVAKTESVTSTIAR